MLVLVQGRPGKADDHLLGADEKLRSLQKIAYAHCLQGG
jgi:hypothetical protein